MKKTILTFGLISGAISSVMMVATLPFENTIGYDRALYLGYTVLVLSFLLVFFGIRAYRDNYCEGQITFGKAAVVGLCITLISCFFYVATWEILYFNFMPDFMDKYAAHLIEKAKASGATAAAIQAKAAELQQYKKQYDNPVFNAATTFLEPFPVGLAVTLISAAFLRKKAGLRTNAAPQPAS